MRKSLLVRATAALFAALFLASPLLHAQGRGRVPGFAAVDRRLIRYADVTLTHAEILTIHNTPKTIVRAFGSNTVIDVVGGMLAFKYTAAYTAGPTSLSLYYTSRNSGSTASGTITSSGFLASVTANVYWMFTGTPGNSTAQANAPIVLQSVTNVAYTGGNAANSLIVHVAYRVHNIGF